MLLQVPPTVALDAVAKVGIVAALTVTILQGIKKLAPNISGWWAVAFNVLLSFGITLVAALTSTPPPSINSLPLLIGSALASAMSASGLHSLARPNAPPLVGTAPANDTGLSPASTFTEPVVGKRWPPMPKGFPEPPTPPSPPMIPAGVAHSTQVDVAVGDVITPSTATQLQQEHAIRLDTEKALVDTQASLDEIRAEYIALVKKAAAQPIPPDPTPAELALHAAVSSVHALDLDRMSPKDAHDFLVNIKKNQLSPLSPTDIAGRPSASVPPGAMS